MSAQRIAGWTALISGGLLVVGLITAAIAGPGALGGTSATAYAGAGPWMMGGGQTGMGMMGAMMNGGVMGPGMMGFGTSGPASAAIPGATEVRVQAANFSFTPSEIRLPKNADVNLTLSNPASSAVAHDLTVPALGIHVVVNAGETRTVGLRGLAAGRYDAYCSVPGHADAGMRATVIVE